MPVILKTHNISLIFCLYYAGIHDDGHNLPQRMYLNLKAEKSMTESTNLKEIKENKQEKTLFDKKSIEKEFESIQVSNISDFFQKKLDKLLKPEDKDFDAIQFCLDKMSEKQVKIDEIKKIEHLLDEDFKNFDLNKFSEESEIESRDDSDEKPKNNKQILNYFSNYLQKIKDETLFHDFLKNIIDRDHKEKLDEDSEKKYYKFKDEYLFDLIKPKFGVSLNSYTGSSDPLLWTLSQFMQKTNHTLARENIELIKILVNHVKKNKHPDEDFLRNFSACISMACALDDAYRESHTPGDQNQILKTIIENCASNISEQNPSYDMVVNSILFPLKENEKIFFRDELNKNIGCYLKEKKDIYLENIKKLNSIVISLSQKNYELSRQLALEYFENQRKFLRNTVHYSPHALIAINIFIIFLPMIPVVSTVVSASIISIVCIATISALPWLSRLDQYLEKEGFYSGKGTLGEYLRNQKKSGIIDSARQFFNFYAGKKEKINWSKSIGDLSVDKELHPMKDILLLESYVLIDNQKTKKLITMVAKKEKKDFSREICDLEKNTDLNSKDTFNFMKEIKNIPNEILIEEEEKDNKLYKINSLIKHDFIYEIVKQKFKNKKLDDKKNVTISDDKISKTKVSETLDRITTYPEVTQSRHLRVLAIVVQSAAQCFFEEESHEIKHEIQKDLGESLSKSANTNSEVVTPYGNIDAFSVILCNLVHEFYPKIQRQLDDNEEPCFVRYKVKSTLAELMVLPLEEKIRNLADENPQKIILQNNLALIKNRLDIRLEEFLLKKCEKTQTQGNIFFDDCADLKGIMRYMNSLIDQSRQKPIEAWRASAEPQDQGILPLVFSVTPIVLSGVTAAISTNFVNQYLHLTPTMIATIVLLCMLLPAAMNKLGSEQSRANRFLPAPVREADRRLTPSREG